MYCILDVTDDDALQQNVSCRQQSLSSAGKKLSTCVVQLMFDAQRLMLFSHFIGNAAASTCMNSCMYI